MARSRDAGYVSAYEVDVAYTEIKDESYKSHSVSRTRTRDRGYVSKTAVAGFIDESFEPIATTTVGSGGTASVTFSSIPAIYKHLQIRLFAQTNRATYGRDAVKINVNSDTGNNYSWHELFGDGSSSATNAASTTNRGEIAEVGTGVGSTFGVAVIDFLDYANTSKYKTIRSLFGGDHNGTIAGFGGTVGLYSTSWQSTTALSSITLAPVNGTQFNQYSHFALYGIKG